MLALVTNSGQQRYSGEDGGWIDYAAYVDDGPEVRYGVARTDTADFAPPRGRRHRRGIWIHRIGHCAEEQATHTQEFSSGLLLWIDGGLNPARKASWPEGAWSPRPEG